LAAVVEVEIDAEPRVVVEPADVARALDADPVARTAYDRLSNSRKREHVLAIESAKKVETRTRQNYGARSRPAAVRPAPRLEAITPDIFAVTQRRHPASRRAG
jgi:Bacteriocin-protection, YdeI or OmpD-Associated